MMSEYMLALMPYGVTIVRASPLVVFVTLRNNSRRDILYHANFWRKSTNKSEY